MTFKIDSAFRLPISGSKRPEPQKLPTISKMVKSASKAILEAGKAALKGERIVVSDQEAKKRLKICQTNKCKRFIEDRQRCAVCGCFMSMKTLLNKSKCPSGLW